jgi:hypothetical protein
MDSRVRCESPGERWSSRRRSGSGPRAEKRGGGTLIEIAGMDLDVREIVPTCRRRLHRPVPGLRSTRTGRQRIRAARVLPISAGVDATAMPASLSAAILSAAAPLPPEMIAPAWPMRLPGGAV